ncbi:cyclic nucleotide-binding domain-containing protein [bacterium]|nr:cyclic nucleotide-binding domain-containing protein [bacterium]
MINFLTKISQLTSIHDVILLSLQGDLLFYIKQRTPDVVDMKKSAYWNEIVTTLNKPKKAEFSFDKGYYYLHCLPIGYVIVGMHDVASLVKIKAACIDVQQKISSPGICKKILLEMLFSADDMEKPMIIKALTPYADIDVARVLISLLKDEEQFKSQAKNNLLLFICQALGYCSSHGAIQPLKNLLVSHKKGERIQNNATVKAAQLSLKQLAQSVDMVQPKMPAAKVEQSERENTPGPLITNTSKVIIDSDLPERKQINDLLSNGQKSKAIAVVIQQIEISAEQKLFGRAERLRELLIQIDSMALMEIIRAAEIIEDAKKASIAKDHYVIWQQLTEILTQEEFVSLYHATSQQYYPNGEIIAKQGQSLPTLFFVNSGQVQLYAVSQDGDVPLKVVRKGEIIGAETFFEASVWTVNAKSLGAELSLLSLQKFKDLSTQYAGIDSKLSDYCARFQSAGTLFKKTKKSTRRFDRTKTSGRVTYLLLDNQGKEMSIGAKGDLLDVSMGGVSLSIHSSKKQNAINLFGKKIRVKIQSGIPASWSMHDGVVRAVRNNDVIGNEYSLHVEFQNYLNSSEVQNIVDSNSASV